VSAATAAREIRIAGRAVGPDHPVYVVAELSANHLGDRERALALVHAAADAGADAVKLQTYTADTITLDCDGPAFRIGAGTPWEGRRLHEIYAEASTPWDWHAELMKAARERGLHAFSSPFDPTAVDFLEALDVPAYKIASFELVDAPLIERAARTGRPLILSTGMATEEEIGQALAAARRGGAREVALLKCTSAYPSPPEALHLRGLQRLAAAFGVPVGLSDHTLDEAVVVAAVALGACMVEKHLTLARADGGPDASFSLEPDELRSLVSAVRRCRTALGEPRLGPTEHERETRRFRRSLFVVADVAEGEPFSEANVRSVRPGDGLAPRHLPEVLGRRAARPVARGTPLSWDLVR